MVTHAYDPSIWEAEADISLWIWDHSGLYREFQDSQDFIDSASKNKTN